MSRNLRITSFPLNGYSREDLREHLKSHGLDTVRCSISYPGGKAAVVEVQPGDDEKLLVLAKGAWLVK